MQAPKGFWEHFDHWLLILALFCISLNYFGHVFNVIAITHNGGQMPVINRQSLQGGMNNMDLVIKHNQNPNVNIPWLVDRFEINFPIINVAEDTALGTAFHYWESKTNYPIEGGINIVSIGDLMRWVGTALFPFLFIIILIRLLKIFKI